jgi:hypothetical protein
VEAALWAALRALEENAVLARRMERRSRAGAKSSASSRYEKRASDAERHAKVLRGILEEGGAEMEGSLTGSPKGAIVVGAACPSKPHPLSPSP